MAQAISIPNTSTSRRKALTAIATLAGAAAVVTPAVAAQTIAHPDAELLALGQQLHEMIPNYGAARDKYDELFHQAWSQAGEACPNFETFATDIAYRKALSEAYERLSQENGTETAFEARWGANRLRSIATRRPSDSQSSRLKRAAGTRRTDCAPVPITSRGRGWRPAI